jgi:hypothetical protein
VRGPPSRRPSRIGEPPVVPEPDSRRLGIVELHPTRRRKSGFRRWRWRGSVVGASDAILVRCARRRITAAKQDRTEHDEQNEP